MHSVAVLAFEGVVPVDLALPVAVFGHVRLADGGRGYDVRVCGAGRSVDAGAFRLAPRHGLSALRSADTLIVPGIDRADRPVPPGVLRELRRAAARGARIASICSGAFVLARTGLLDGRRATTHWMGAEGLARRHSAVQVDPEIGSASGWERV